jgi:hypothetical protein
MKIVKISQNYFVDVDWKTLHPPKKEYYGNFGGIATIYDFYGYINDDNTLAYKLKLFVGDSQFKFIANSIHSREPIVNSTFYDAEEFKEALVGVGVPLEILGISDFDIKPPHEIRLIKDESLEMFIRVAPSDVPGKFSISYTVTNINSGETIADSVYVDKKNNIDFIYKEAIIIADRLAGYVKTNKGYVQARSDKKLVTSQDYGGYYSGAVPEYQGSHIGSPSVDTSNLSSQFGDVQKSVDLVNRFDSNLLKNIVYMFNFSKSGVYGVYVPALDQAVKTEELKKRLEAMGYEIVEENGALSAYPTEQDKDPQTIEAEIKRIYDDLESKGGSVLGLNINDTQNEVQGSFNNLQELVPPEKHVELKNDLMIAHMAATMAHEATHAHGHEDEGMPTQVETALLNSAIREIQQKYGIEGELKLTRGSSANWYKKAQSMPFYPPSGSDLKGRHGQQSNDLQGQPDFGMMAHQYSNRAIEEMLGRHFQSPLPPDLSPENDTIELQLRKYTRDGFKLDPTLVFDLLLKDYRTEDNRSYRTMEELLDETRPQPLMLPIKSASKMVKEATVFGWMNNLEISDGSTIPGMGDRVMEWDDRDESFSEEEDWIKQQPRYNPSYDLKGFYYRWIEPRFKPQLWDSYVDNSGTHPAKRFASKDDLGFVVDSISKIRSQILNWSFPATRFICSEDMIMVVNKCMSDCDINIDIFSLGELNGEEVYACWVHKGVESENIKLVENAIQNNDENLKEIMEEKVGYKPTLVSAIQEIMDAVKETCKEYDIHDVYAIGSYAREISFGDNSPEVEDLEFTSDNPTNCVKFGYLVAQSLGLDPKINSEKKSLCFFYKGVPVHFNGGRRIDKVEQMMAKGGIGMSSCIMHDICNKDFTINMKAYSPSSNKVTSLFGNDKVIKTIFNAEDVITLNPILILRALYLSLRYDLKIDSELGTAMEKCALLLPSKCKDDVLEFAFSKIESLDKEEAQVLFQKYGLDKIHS